MHERLEFSLLLNVQLAETPFLYDPSEIVDLGEQPFQF